MRKVTKSFGIGSSRTPILRGIDLEIAQGEIVMFAGPSGSGKTTLLSILGCILAPDQGDVTVLGQRIVGAEPEQLAAFRRAFLGFVFQTFNLFPTLSALDNICLALTMRGVRLSQARQRSCAMLEQVHLGSRLHLRPAQLSSGECQRVAIARALVHEPRILFADEPTAALDSENGLAVMELISNIVRVEGMTLVVVSHDPRIFGYAHRLLRLEDGRVLGEVASTERRRAWQERVA